MPAPIPFLSKPCLFDKYHSFPSNSCPPLPSFDTINRLPAQQHSSNSSTVCASRLSPDSSTHTQTTNTDETKPLLDHRQPLYLAALTRCCAFAHSCRSSLDLWKARCPFHLLVFFRRADISRYGQSASFKATPDPLQTKSLVSIP